MNSANETSDDGDWNSRLMLAEQSYYVATARAVGRTRRSLVAGASRVGTVARMVPAGSMNWREAMLIENPW